MAADQWESSINHIANTQHVVNRWRHRGPFEYEYEYEYRCTEYEYRRTEYEYDSPDELLQSLRLRGHRLAAE